MTATMPFWPPQPVRIWAGTDSFRRIVSDAAWAVEAKMDDHRCVLERLDGKTLRAWSNKGLPLAMDPSVRETIERLVPAACAVDGCLIGPRGGEPAYMAFDLPLLGGRPLDEDLDARRARLGDMGFTLVQRLPNDPASFQAALDMGQQIEGIVLKMRSARYAFKGGPKIKDPSWLKAKVASRMVPGGSYTPKPPPLVPRGDGRSN